MIEWVDALLCRWGRWSVRRESAALGYGSASPMFRDCTVGGGYSPEFDPGFTPRDLLDCDAAVTALPLVLRVVVIAHYQRSRSLRDTARNCGIKADTVKKYLGQAHAAMEPGLREATRHA